SEAAVMLLNVSFDEQIKMKEMFDRVIQNVRVNWRQRGHDNSVVLVSPKGRTDALILMAFREEHKERRYEFMQSVAGQAFGKSHVTRCLVIGINIDRRSLPYGVIGVFTK
ncbi:MAG TPA: hypothetical protein VGB89_05085, partial [Bacteroidota bacterium]